MKFLTVIVVALSFSAFADSHEMMKKEDMMKMPFDQHKKMMQEKLEKKSAMVDEGKKCVDAAKDNSALMECHNKMMEEHHAMRDEMKGKMKDMKKKM